MITKINGNIIYKGVFENFNLFFKTPITHNINTIISRRFIPLEKPKGSLRSWPSTIPANKDSNKKLFMVKIRKQLL